MLLTGFCSILQSFDYGCFCFFCYIIILNRQASIFELPQALGMNEASVSKHPTCAILFETIQERDRDFDQDIYMFR